MSFREELRKIRREYRQELTNLAKRQEELDAKVDAGFEKMESRLVALQDQMSAMVEDNRQLRADLKESSRTMLGRQRLTEERLGKMLDLVEQESEKREVEIQTADSEVKARLESLEGLVPPDLASRLEALEKRDNPAA